MSRCYRIQVSEALKRHVEVDDGITTSLELLDILPPERMRELLRAQLEERGYAPETDGSGRLRKELPEGVSVVVDLDDGSVHLGVRAEADLELHRTTTAQTNADDPAVREKVKASVRRALEREADAETEAMRQAATAALEAALSGIRGELDQAVTRATAEALKEKARQLGDVQEIHEDPETGAVTIRVRV